MDRRRTEGASERAREVTAAELALMAASVVLAAVILITTAPARVALAGAAKGTAPARSA